MRVTYHRDRSVICFVLAWTLWLACPRAAGAQDRSAARTADAAAIRAHIESIFRAFVDKDREKLVATHGTNWRGFTPWSGRVIRGLNDYMTSATFPEGLPN